MNLKIIMSAINEPKLAINAVSMTKFVFMDIKKAVAKGAVGPKDKSIPAIRIER